MLHRRRIGRVHRYPLAVVEVREPEATHGVEVVFGFWGKPSGGWEGAGRRAPLKSRPHGRPLFPSDPGKEKHLQSPPAISRVGPTTRHQAHRTAFPDQHTHRAQVVAAPPTARPLGLPIAKLFIEHRFQQIYSPPVSNHSKDLSNSRLMASRTSAPTSLRPRSTADK